MLRFLRALPAVVLFATACSAASFPELPAIGAPPDASPRSDAAADSPSTDDPGPDLGAQPRPNGSATAPPVTASARLADVEVPGAAAPARLRVTSLGIDAPVLGVGISDGELEVLDDVVNVGWYRHGPSPGETGSAVLAAHVDTARDGPGVFFELGSLESGDRIDIELADGTALVFFVESIQRHPKAELPAAELFSREGDPRVALITCGGAFDRSAGRYSDNVVVVARP